MAFVVQDDGSWRALYLESLDTLAGFSLPPAASPDPDAKPRLSFEPDEIEVAAGDEAFDLTGSLANTADEPKDYAADVLLGYSIQNGAEYVEWVELTPPSWEIIQAGEQVDFNIHVTLKPSWSTVPDGTRVRLRIDVVQETNRQGRHPTSLTVILSSCCNGTPPPTPSPTATSTPTPTVTTTTTGEFVDCTGANPHPEGKTLADRYIVSYEEIMGWFCQGFGFGEIDLAYGWRDEYHVSVTDIFNMRISCMGWGAIKQELEGKIARATAACAGGTVAGGRCDPVSTRLLSVREAG